MKAIGTVESVDGTAAVVVSKRSSACAACDKCENGAACHAQLVFGKQSEDVKIKVKNTVGAKVGDTVELEASSLKTLFAAAVVFILPIIAAVSGYLIASEKFHGELPCVAIMLLSFSACFFILVKLMNVYVKKNLTVHAVKILEESDI